MRDCEQCGYPLDQNALQTCPKCGETSYEQGGNSILEIDVAHHGETWEISRIKILQAVDQSLQKSLQGVKIIHGYGSSSGYAVIAPRAIALMRHLAEQYGGRYTLDKNTPGASLIWWNKACKQKNDQSLQQAQTKSRINSPKINQLNSNWFEQALRNHKGNKPT